MAQRIDKSTWGDGPWMTEPDRKRWLSDIGDYPCAILRNASLGNWCGYVGVKSDHPLWDVHYDQGYKDDADPKIAAAINSLRVHGGLTFSYWDEEQTRWPQGMLPRRQRLWFFGFDCCHAYDLTPGLPFFPKDVVYRTMAYAIDNCEDLAMQLENVRKSF